MTIKYCSDIVWPKELSAYFSCFLLMFDREFSFFFAFYHSLIGNFLLFAFSHSLIGNFLLLQGLTFSIWVKIYDKLGFWLKDCGKAGHDICQVFGQQFGGKGDVQHYCHGTHATMMIRRFYAKLVMHAPMWTLKNQVFMVM